MTTTTTPFPRTWWPLFDTTAWFGLHEQIQSHPYVHQLILQVLQGYLPLTLPQYPAYHIHQVMFLHGEFTFFIQHKESLVCFTLFTFWSDILHQSIPEQVWFDLPILATPWETEYTCLAFLLPLPVRHLQVEEITHWLFFHQQHATYEHIEYWLNQPPPTYNLSNTNTSIESTRRVRRKVTEFSSSMS